MRIIIFLFLVSFFSCTKSKEVETKIVSPEEMQTLLKMDNIQLVDIRTPTEYKDGYIPDAINIDFLSPTFLEEIEQLDKEKPIIIYCRSGRRSAKCSEKLVDAGFKKIYDLEGGYSKWKFIENINNE